MGLQIKNKQKLVDILSLSPEEMAQEEFAFRIEQAQVNSDQEILDIKKQISNQNKKIVNCMRIEPFSISNVYNEKTVLELLERQLKALLDLRTELF